METEREMRAFSIVKRLKSFRYAIRGIYVFIKTQPNAWVHLVGALIAIFLGIYLKINEGEWLSLIIVTGLVLITEAFNTAIEFDIDLTSPEYHPYARDTKDVAAGAVLISVILASIAGLIIFLPKILGAK